MAKMYLAIFFSVVVGVIAASPVPIIQKTFYSVWFKIKMVRNKKALKPGYKKAIITLKKGQSIDLSTGV